MALTHRDASIHMLLYSQILLGPQTESNSVLSTLVVMSPQTSKAPLTLKVFLAEGPGHHAFEDGDRILLTELLSLEMLETGNRSEYQILIKKEGSTRTSNTDDKPVCRSVLKT